MNSAIVASRPLRSGHCTRSTAVFFIGDSSSFSANCKRGLSQTRMALCYGWKRLQERLVPPRTDGIVESSLYVSDVPRSISFYEDIFGFRVISDFGTGLRHASG